jgi:hypothetical protein
VGITLKVINSELERLGSHALVVHERHSAVRKLTLEVTQMARIEDVS